MMLASSRKAQISFSSRRFQLIRRWQGTREKLRFQRIPRRLTGGLRAVVLDPASGPWPGLGQWSSWWSSWWWSSW